MAERRTWTPEEDNALKHLKQVLNIKKWSQISRKLESEYQLFGRNGKQCRQRYTNNLMKTINFSEFSSEDEEKLFKLHNKIGNKWSQISKEFEGRTDNQVKNHFHSKLRKAIRKLNKEIKLYFKRAYKPYKLNIVYEIVYASDFRFSPKTCLDQENLMFFNDLKNILLEYVGGIVQQKTQISDLSTNEQTLLLDSKLELFQKHFKLNKGTFSKSKQNKNISTRKFDQKLKGNALTQSSQSWDVIEDSKIDEQRSQRDSIYEEASVQFISQLNKTSQETIIKGDQATSMDSGQAETVDQNPMQIKCQEKRALQAKQNLSRMMETINHKIIHSLIEEKEFPQVDMEGKMSIKSFESLREFEDSYLNDSEINWMLKRFESVSNLESRLFE